MTLNSHEAAISRRGLLTSAGLGTLGLAAGAHATKSSVTSLADDRAKPTAILVRGEKIAAVGSDAEIMRHRTGDTIVVDARGRRLIPGLNDNHLHGIRGGLQFNGELRWDGVRSLAEGLQMIREQAARTPPDQWVRVMGGWSPFQFAERRFPTIAELNAAGGGAKVLVLFAYSKAFVNAAGRAAMGLTPASAAQPGGRFDFSDGGVTASGTPTIYKVLAKLPVLARADQLNSTRHFLRELSRFGMTSFVDAGATGVDYPTDYAAIAELASLPNFPLRISSFVFAQQKGSEIASFRTWTTGNRVGVNMARRLTGYVLEGGGEILAWDASDYEDFMSPRPEWQPGVTEQLQDVVRILVAKKWPIRVHASYDETISHILDVFEPAFESAGYAERWVIDHAETITPRTIARIKALGGGIAVQDRLAFSGEFFAERYGDAAAARAQPLRAMIDAGVPLSAGTDATRVSSYNPWPSLYWFTTRRTLGGKQFGGSENILSREEALRLYTTGSAWLSNEDAVKGRIAPGFYADFALLSADYMTVPAEEILGIESVLTVTGGDIVYAADPFGALAPPALPAPTPGWSPAAAFKPYSSVTRSKRKPA
jgi:predicted amidohydrolase YtcJ